MKDVIITLISTFIVLELIYRTKLWIFENQLYKYKEWDDDACAYKPVNTTYKNKNIKIFCDEKVITPQEIKEFIIDGYVIYTIFINDIPAIFFVSIGGVCLTKRYLYLNENYDTSEVFKILRKYRKNRRRALNKEISKTFEEKAKKKSLF